MFGKRKTDALVVGAGPVGLFSALSLARRNVDVEIVDEEWRTGMHSYALALHPESLALLEESGLAAPLLERGRRLDRIAFYEGEERQTALDLADASSAHPPLLVLPQSDLESALETALGERDVAVRWNHSLTGLRTEDDVVHAGVDELAKVSGGYAVATTEWSVERSLSYRARFLVGADGHRSRVRRLLDIPFPPVREGRTFAVFELETGIDLADEVRVVLENGRVNVLWPLPDGRCRWSFEVPEPPRTPDRTKGRLAVQLGRWSFPHAPRESLLEMLRERAPWFGVDVGELRWSLVVRFRPRLAERFGEGRTWLAGDAGHVASPVGVQSLNVGLREAHDLAGQIADVLGGADPATLEAYGRERATEWKRQLGLLSLTRDDAPAWVRREPQRVLGCLPASGDRLAALASEIGIELGGE